MRVMTEIPPRVETKLGRGEDEQYVNVQNEDFSLNFTIFKFSSFKISNSPLIWETDDVWVHPVLGVELKTALRVCDGEIFYLF